MYLSEPWSEHSNACALYRLGEMRGMIVEIYLWAFRQNKDLFGSNFTKPENTLYQLSAKPVGVNLSIFTKPCTGPALFVTVFMLYFLPIIARAPSDHWSTMSDFPNKGVSFVERSFPRVPEGRRGKGLWSRHSSTLLFSQSCSCRLSKPQVVRGLMMNHRSTAGSRG